MSAPSLSWQCPPDPQRHHGGLETMSLLWLLRLANDTGLLRPILSDSPPDIIPFPLPQGNSVLMRLTATPLWKQKFLISTTILCSLPEAGEWNKVWFELEFPSLGHSPNAYLFFSHYGSWPQYSNSISLFWNGRRLSCCFSVATSQKYFVTAQHEKYLTKHWWSFITWCGNQLIPDWQM